MELAILCEVFSRSPLGLVKGLIGSVNGGLSGWDIVTCHTRHKSCAVVKHGILIRSIRAKTDMKDYGE